jgi:hypothetical protein
MARIITSEKRSVSCVAHSVVFGRVRGQHGRHKYKLEINIRTVIKQTLSKLVYGILLPLTGA